MKVHKLLEEHIKRNRERYRTSDRWEKGLILNEICRTWGVGRKYVISRLSGKRGPSGLPKGRVPIYDDPRLIEHVTVLWDSMERICSIRMKAALPLWLPFYKHPEFTKKQAEQILSMSASTLGRLIGRGMKHVKGLSLTRKRKFFKYKIPLHEFSSKVINVGHVAADTVGHCGDRADGIFANSLTVTDRLTQWTENRALLGKTAPAVERALHAIEKDLPFLILSLQSDCGTEFLNYTFLKYLQNRPRPIILSRSRPYHKNDNAHVEQKNNTHVRAVFGYDRVEDIELVRLMNDIYENYWNPLHNYFLPSLKLKEKERNGARITKRYEPAKTPYDRLMQAPNFSEERKAKVQERFKSLNPFELKAGLEKKLELFFSILKNRNNVQKAA